MQEIMKIGTVSCEGRLIGPNEESFPNWNEIFHGLRNLSRFCGQQTDPELDWNVLKHSVAVAILSGEFIPGILHDYPEIFTNDTPTPYKTDEQRKFEKACMVVAANYLENKIPGYKKEYILESKYKPSDSVLLDIEARHVINCPDHYHKKFFEYNLEKYKVPFDKAKVEALFQKLLKIPSHQILRAIKAYMYEFTKYCEEHGYSKEVEEKTSQDFLQIFDIENVVKSRFENLDKPTKISKPEDYLKVENTSDKKAFWTLLIFTVFSVILMYFVCTNYLFSP